MLQKYQKQLEDFGLTKNEANTYLALLDNGSSTAAEISQHAALNRSTVYVQLTTLIEYGLVSSYKQKKKTFFAPESPKNLEQLLDKKMQTLQAQKQNIDTYIPNLLNLFAVQDDRPSIRTFSGKAGLLTMRNELISSGVATYHAAYSFDDLYAIFSPEELMDFSNKRAAAGIHAYIMYNKQGRDAMVVPPQDLRRVNRKNFPFSSDVYVYGDTVSIASTSGNIFGVTIKNQQIADSVRSLFMLAWEATTK